MHRGVLALVLVACHSPASPRPQLPLVTTGESSQWIRTGHYDEAVALCHDFARVYPSVTCDEIGKTGEDRPIVALRIARHHAQRVPVIYVQAGIHAGEIEGKDAGLWFLRDLLDGKVAPGALDAVDVVFVPVVNPDGHERFGPNNRPNQRGPEEMGFRTNAARLNINRDFVKADTPEAQALLRVIAARDPVLLVDLHTTDGAKFEHDISFNTAPVAARPGDQLAETAHALSDALIERMTALGHLPLGFYPTFISEDDPLSGFAIGEAPPRFSQTYMALRSRLGVLVETHSWRTYKERAQSTYHALQSIFELATREAARWSAVEHAADRADQQLRGNPLPVVFENGPHTTEIAFRGYAFEKVPSDISGGTWTKYAESKPEVWHVKLHDELIPKVSVAVPKAGYIVDGGFAPQIGAVLARHGIAYRLLPDQLRGDVEVFRATKVTYQPPFEGRTRTQLEGAWTRETRTFERGAIFVPLAQPAVRLIVQLLDPAAPDSLAQWGELNVVFERREYMEPYVAEEAARAMIARDPSLRTQLDAAVAADPELAKSPTQRLEWFYRRHLAWDERTNLLPIYKTDRDFARLVP
ncbi:MAG: hypothetical protein JWO36_7133 [Myxococcales bacterium]|nr:hypothetical protein [Myxococcales bacterium]